MGPKAWATSELRADENGKEHNPDELEEGKQSASESGHKKISLRKR
jgi:hypothetical protein